MCGAEVADAAGSHCALWALPAGGQAQLPLPGRDTIVTAAAVDLPV